jgi:hypothetical protein
VEEHEYIHEEEVCTKEDKQLAYDTPSDLSDEVDDTSFLDGYIPLTNQQKMRMKHLMITMMNCSNHPMLQIQHLSLCMMIMMKEVQT